MNSESRNRVIGGSGGTTYWAGFMKTVLEAALDSIARSTELGVTPQIAVLLKGRKWPKSGRVKLFGRHGGPYGQCVSEEEGGVIALFSARDVVDAIKKASK